jgi:hypothetical protein
MSQLNLQGTDCRQNPLFRQTSQHNLGSRKKSVSVNVPIPPSTNPLPPAGSGGGSYGSSLTEEHYANVPPDEELFENSLSKAIEAFRVNLGLEDDSFIRNTLHIREIPAGSYVTKEDSQEVSQIS